MWTRGRLTTHGIPCRMWYAQPAALHSNPPAWVARGRGYGPTAGAGAQQRPRSLSVGDLAAGIAGLGKGGLCKFTPSLCDGPPQDLAVAMYHIINASAVDPSADPWGEALAAEAGNFQNWALYCFIIGALLCGQLPLKGAGEASGQALL